MKEFKTLVILRIAELQKLIDNHKTQTNSDLMALDFINKLLKLNKEILLCLQEY